MFYFDYYVGYFMYKPYRIKFYHDYMNRTYPDRYPKKD